MKTIALLGQPNSGKSTLYNALTGSHQRVGNWPGKTVEKAEGDFYYKDQLFRIVDLPGSYGLTANSEEEVVTRDYIERGRVDASQLERSLFMLADFAGIKCPALLVLNMMDVAKEKDTKIDVLKMEQVLGIPVLGFTALDSDRYLEFYETLERAVENPKTVLTEGIRKLVEDEENSPLNQLESLLQGADFGVRENFWMASKLLENDPLVKAEVCATVDSGRLARIDRILNEERSAGGLITGEAKYRWISELLRHCVTEKKSSVVLSRFDKIATHRVKGKLLAFGIMALTLVACMVLASPGMLIGMGLIPWCASALHPVFENFGVWPVIESFVCGVLIGGGGLTVGMTSFVFAILFVFALVENVGYMARFSYVFDSWLSRLGLHGKAIMPLFSGLACTAGAVCGTRVLDTRGQRLFALVLLWSIPCGAKLSVVLFLSSAFFGPASLLFAFVYVILIFGSFYLSSRLFGAKLMPVEERVGMIMELPPYHKPKWGALFRYVLGRTKDTFFRVLKVVLLVAVVFWLLSFSSTGLMENSILYKVGTVIEPFTKLFGMSWQLFMAFIASCVGKEGAIGVLGTIFSGSGSSIGMATVMGEASIANVNELLLANVSKPEALAFIFAITFNKIFINLKIIK